MKYIKKFEIDNGSSVEEYIPIPPIATSEAIGGIKASLRAEENVEAAIDENGSLFVPEYPSLDNKVNKNGYNEEDYGKVLGTDNDGNVVLKEVKSASDNNPIGIVEKTLNPNVSDCFNSSIKNLKMYGQSTQITTTGKNKFNIDGNINTPPNGPQVIKNSVENGVLTSNYNAAIEQLAGQLISVESGKQYTISLEIISVGSGNGAYVAIYKNGDPFYAPNLLVGTWKTTITATVDEILLTFGNNDGTGAKFTNIQVEEGATATPYEPYTEGQPSPSPQYPQEITAISEFSGQVNNGSEQSQPFTYTPTNPMYSTQDGSIADYVDVEKGVEVYNMGTIVYDGSNDESWSVYPLKKGFTIRLAKLKSGMAVKGWCDKFVVKDNITYETGIILGLNNNYLYIAGINDTIETVEDLKVWLAQNPITVIYPLATPTETSIPQEQLSMLRALYTYTGVTNFLCNAPISFTYEQSLQTIIDNILKSINNINANKLLLQGGI